MEITFESKQNTLTSSDTDFHFMEKEILNYKVRIYPFENHHKLEIKSDPRTIDINRLFLYNELFLEELEAPGTTFKFSIIFNKEVIGTLHFDYYHDTDFKTFQVCMFLDVFSNVNDVTFVFKNIQNFSINK